MDSCYVSFPSVQYRKTLKPYQFLHQQIDLLDWILRHFFEWKHLHVSSFHANIIIYQYIIIMIFFYTFMSVVGSKQCIQIYVLGVHSSPLSTFPIAYYGSKLLYTMPIVRVQLTVNRTECSQFIREDSCSYHLRRLFHLARPSKGSVVAGQLLKTLKACAMIKTFQRREDYN